MKVKEPANITRRWRTAAITRLLLTSALGGFGLGTAVVPPALAQSATQAHSFDIPAQPLPTALNAFGRQSGLQVSLAAAAARGLTSRAVKGNYTSSQALSLLLAGSGIPFQITTDGTALIGSTAPIEPAVSADGSLLLDTITISTSGAATEGSGSYAAAQASSATGLALSVRETPQSVSVTTDQRIKDQGFASAKEVLNYTTGVSSVSYETDRDSTYARGYWVGNYIVDGVSLPTYEGWYSGVSLSSTAAIYDRVEVLRGATGLLTGSGEPGAAVSIARKRATATKPEGSMELRYGSWNRIGGTVDVGTPLNADASVRGRFIMDVASEDSFVDRYHLNRQTYYAAIDADLTPSTRLRFSLEHRNHDPRGTMWGELPAIFTNGEPTNFPRSFSNAPDWAYWASWQTSAVAKLEHDFDNGWQAQATFGATLRKQDAALLYMFGDLDQATGEGLQGSAWGGIEYTRLMTFDTRASGPVELFGRSHDLNFGVSLDRDWIKRDWPGYSGEIAPIGSIYDWDGTYPQPDWNPLGDADWDSNRTKLSAYASGQFSISDPLKLILGGRYTDWKSEFQTDDRQFKEFTPFAGAVYDLNDEWSLYASYTEVFNPQNRRDRNGDYLDPITGKSYEIGAKAELFDGGMNATLAVFDTEQDNVAVRDGDVLVPGTTEFAYRGAKGVRSKGIELELAGEIRPGWSLFFGASALRMRDANDDRHAPEQPTRTIKIFTSYELPGQWDQWTVGGGLRWQNRSWAEVETGGSTYRVTQPAYAVVDVMARYDFNETWSAQLNVNNLFDKTYYNGPGSQVTYGAPRNAMLTLTSRF